MAAGGGGGAGAEGRPRQTLFVAAQGARARPGMEGEGGRRWPPAVYVGETGQPATGPINNDCSCLKSREKYKEKYFYIRYLSLCAFSMKECVHLSLMFIFI